MRIYLSLSLGELSKNSSKTSYVSSVLYIFKASSFSVQSPSVRNEHQLLNSVHKKRDPTTQYKQIHLSRPPSCLRPYLIEKNQLFKQGDTSLSSGFKIQISDTFKQCHSIKLPVSDIKWKIKSSHISRIYYSTWYQIKINRN